MFILMPNTKGRPGRQVAFFFVIYASLDVFFGWGSKKSCESCVFYCVLNTTCSWDIFCYAINHHPAWFEWIIDIGIVNILEPFRRVKFHAMGP